MADHLKTEVVEFDWQKDLAELEGEALKNEAKRRLAAAASSAERECSWLADRVSEIQQGDLWKSLADSWESLCSEYFGRPREFVDSVVAGVSALRARGHTGPITAAEAIAAVPKADTHGGKRDGAGRKAADAISEIDPAVVHGGSNQGENFPLKKERKTGSQSPERIIARLKRDAETNPKAQALLDTLEAGDISARAAAIEMGWVKPPDPARIVEKQREKLAPDEQVRIWREWGRALPDEAIERYDAAQDAFLNLTEIEQGRFLRWAKGYMNSAKAA